MAFTHLNEYSQVNITERTINAEIFYLLCSLQIRQISMQAVIFYVKF